MARRLHIHNAADRHYAALSRDHPSTKGDTMKRLLALALAATFALPSFALLSGCNTVEGAGKDIQKGGEKIKDEARENKKY